jgi:Family of unknown function (DUF6459)
MNPFHEKVVALHAAVPVASVQGTLALDLHPQHDPPELLPAQGRSSGDVVAIDHRARTRLEQWAHRYAQAAVEIVGGDRPVTQLLRWTAPGVYADLARRAQLVARAAGQRPGQGRVQAVRPQVVGVRTCFVEPEAAEVSAHVRYGHRSRAVALRFEIRDDRWQCVALEFA